MGTITTAMLTTFKKGLFKGSHKFLATSGDTFKIALIKSTPTASFGAANTKYADLATDEASGTGYTAGGEALTNVDPTTSGTTALVDFSPDPSWSNATLSVDGCMIWNSTTLDTENGVSVHDFGGTQSVTAGTLTVLMPTADATNAILRIA